MYSFRLHNFLTSAILLFVFSIFLVNEASPGAGVDPKVDLSLDTQLYLKNLEEQRCAEISYKITKACKQNRFNDCEKDADFCSQSNSEEATFDAMRVLSTSLGAPEFSQSQYESRCHTSTYDKWESKYTKATDRLEKIKDDINKLNEKMAEALKESHKSKNEIIRKSNSDIEKIAEEAYKNQKTRLAKAKESLIETHQIQKEIDRSNKEIANLESRKAKKLTERAKMLIDMSNATITSTCTEQINKLVAQAKQNTKFASLTSTIKDLSTKRQAITTFYRECINKAVQGRNSTIDEFKNDLNSIDKDISFHQSEIERKRAELQQTQLNIKAAERIDAQRDFQMQQEQVTKFNQHMKEYQDAESDYQAQVSSYDSALKQKQLDLNRSSNILYNLERREPPENLTSGSGFEEIIGLYNQMKALNCDDNTKGSALTPVKK